MQSPAHSRTDALIRLSRRSLWTAFLLIAAIGATGILQLLAPASQAGQKLAMLLPVFIVMAVVGLRRIARPDAVGMAIVLADELRHIALGRAYRNGLVAVLVLQPLLAVALATAGVVNALPVMAAATALAGALAFLGSFLYFDR